MSKGFFKSPIGTIEILSENGRITKIDLIGYKTDYEKCNKRDAEFCRNPADDNVINNTKQQLAEYFDGTRKTFEVDIDPHGTEFQKAIWNVLMTIPYGMTMSYAQVAEAAGYPKSHRAAGSAVGKNPLLIIVPCHRVIKADGSLGGFSCGIENKIILQKTEGIL
ncbi:MAG: methylated-DNA--[Firmicutes bacterium]|nr:methylated-DNA--[protein]-cysteine S-methyltransferase [Bacillota bacterium]